MNNHMNYPTIRLTSASDPLRILLVEDSKGDAILIRNTLKGAIPEEHTVEHVTNLANALAMLSTNEFDVALLDRTLPDADEFDGLHSIQNMSPTLPIIFLTAYKDEQMALGAIEQGAQDYLFKDKIDDHVIRRAIQYAVLRKQFEGVLILRANYDSLTGLANRTLFESRLDMAIARMKRQDGKLAVLFLDLDGFKQINDSYGHMTGDKLLKDIGKRLKGALRPYDTPARFGGDEFVILLEGLPDVGHGSVVAEKIITLFDEQFDISGRKLDVGVSIGIVNASTKDFPDRKALIQQADSAMYEAKAQSGSHYVVASHPSDKQAKNA